MQGLTGQFQGVNVIVPPATVRRLVILGLLPGRTTALGLLLALVGSTLFIYDRLFGAGSSTGCRTCRAEMVQRP